jgi:hypothetical protein
VLQTGHRSRLRLGRRPGCGRRLSAQDRRGEQHVVATLPVANPFVGAFGAGALWIGSGSDVLRVDTATNRVTARIAVGGDAIVQAFGAGTAWVDLPNGVARIDAATNAVVARIRLPGAAREVPHWVVVDAAAPDRPTRGRA